MATTVLAEFDEEDIAEMAKKLKEGKVFIKSFQYSDMEDYRQYVHFDVTGNLGYTIDFRAQICIIRIENAGQIVPCKIIKKGYPKIGALITWKD